MTSGKRGYGCVKFKRFAEREKALYKYMNAMTEKTGLDDETTLKCKMEGFRTGWCTADNRRRKENYTVIPNKHLDKLHKYKHAYSLLMNLWDTFDEETKDKITKQLVTIGLWTEDRLEGQKKE